MVVGGEVGGLVGGEVGGLVGGGVVGCCFATWRVIEVPFGTTLPGPGVLSVAGMTWQPGGNLRWQISSALGAGDGITQSRLNGSGALDLTGLSSANPFNVQLVPLGPNNTSGAVYDFDNTKSYSWPLATFGSITGFSPSKFNVDSSAFAASNPLGGGSFGVAQSGNTLMLTFTPVPEPGTCLALAAVGLLVGRVVRRRAAGAVVASVP